MPDQYRELFEFAPVGLILSENRIIRKANRLFAEIFASDVTAMENQPLAELYPTTGEYQDIGSKGLEAMRRTGRYQDERIMRRLNGELFWCRVSGRSLSDSHPFRRAIWSFTDISDERPVVDLSPRERQVAMLLGEGQTTKSIARLLSISPRTVEAHRARLLDKLGARNTAELIANLMGMPL